MEYVDFMLTGDPAQAKATVSEALERRKFKLSWADEWTATAERGNKIANALLGAFAQYFKVGVVIRTDEASGHGIVRIERGSRGMMGGAIGVARTNKNMKQLAEELTTAWQSSGVLVNATQA
jgi:hypothetical protein